MKEACFHLIFSSQGLLWKPSKQNDYYEVKKKRREREKKKSWKRVQFPMRPNNRMSDALQVQLK
jgi:hypothetical protein